MVGIRNEKCSGEGYFPVENGIRTVMLRMKKNVPSYIKVDGYTSLVTYEDQVRTCMFCNEEGHERKECPHRAENRINIIRRPNAPVVQNNDKGEKKLYAEVTRNRIVEVIENIEERTPQEEPARPQDHENQGENLTKTRQNDENDISSQDIIEASQNIETKTTKRSKRARVKTVNTSSEEEKLIPKLKIKLSNLEYSGSGKREEEGGNEHTCEADSKSDDECERDSKSDDECEIDSKSDDECEMDSKSGDECERESGKEEIM